MGFERVMPELTADVFVSEYLALLAEGWTPDVVEFVARVPDELQEQVFQEIDAALANRNSSQQSSAQDTSESPPVVVEPTPDPMAEEDPIAEEPVAVEPLAVDPVAAEPAPQAPVLSEPPAVDPPMVAEPPITPPTPLTPAVEALAKRFAEATHGADVDEAPFEEAQPAAPVHDEPVSAEPAPAAARARDEQVLPKSTRSLRESDQIVVEAGQAPGDKRELPRRTYTPGSFLKTIAKVIPADIRMQWMGDLLASRADQRDFGMPESEIRLYTIERVLEGVAQRAPLQPVPKLEDSATRLPGLTWFAWRLAGPALFIGYLTGSAGLLLGGAATVIAAVLVVLVLAARKNVLDYPETRLLNGVLGTCIVCLTFACVAGLLTAGLVALSAAIGQAQIAAAAVHTLAFLTTGMVCLLSARGWIPKPWSPKRLIRI